MALPVLSSANMSPRVSHDSVTKDPAVRVCVGVIVGAHGVRGLVRVKSFTEDPCAIGDYGVLTGQGGKVSFPLSVVRTSKGSVLCRIDGITDRSSAESLRAQKLYAPRERFPSLEEEGSFYHADLIGLSVFGPNGAPVGVVRALFDFGAGDVMEIQDLSGGSFFVPFTRASVPIVDIAQRRVGLGCDEHLFKAFPSDVPPGQLKGRDEQSSRFPETSLDTNG